MDKSFYKKRDHWMKYNKNRPLYHGTRTKDPDKIKEMGVCTSFSSCKEATEGILSALDHFNKKDILQQDTAASEMIKELVREICNDERRTVYLSSGTEEQACSWANRNPEIITLVLSAIDVPDEMIDEYLNNQFGEPYVLKMNETYPVEDQNINTGQVCLLPEEIFEISKCLRSD